MFFPLCNPSCNSAAKLSNFFHLPKLFLENGTTKAMYKKTGTAML